jgi:hypothetical protein
MADNRAGQNGQKVDLTTAISVTDAEALANAASECCFVENTIAKSLPTTTEMSLNGKKVVSFARNR